MPRNIRGRLALVQAATSLGCIAAVAVLIVLVQLWNERQERGRMMERAMDGFLTAPGPGQLEAQAIGLQFFRPAARSSVPAPRELSHLSPGIHRGVRVGTERYDVLVRELAPGDAAYVTYDPSLWQSATGRAASLAAAGIGLTAVLALLVARWGTGVALAPLDRIIGRVRALKPAVRRQRLEAEADDGELRTIVDALNEFMQELDQVRDRERIFASAASHELRTPLTVIRGAAEVLAATPGVPAPVLSRIHQSVADATSDLDALLSLSQGRDLPPSESLRLDELLPRLAEPYVEQARAQGTRLVWEFRGCQELRASPAVLGMIFTNLLRNALRASPGGTVEIRVEPGSLVVRDDGAHTPPERLLNSFEPGTEGRQGGTGLGLYIAKTLADRKGWGLLFRSLGGGAREAVLLLGTSAVAALEPQPAQLLRRV